MLILKEIKGNKNFHELVKYAYLLHSFNKDYIDDFVCGTSENPFHMFKNKDGKTYYVSVGTRFTDHSACYEVFTVEIMEAEGKISDKSFKTNFALVLKSSLDKDYCPDINTLKFDYEGTERCGWGNRLDYDYDSPVCSEEQTLENFLYAMEIIGFDRNKVLRCLKGDISAREIYQEVASDELKDYSIIELVGRRILIKGNTIVAGRLDQVDLVEEIVLPEGLITIDLERTYISRAKLGNRQFKFINVNCKFEKGIGSPNHLDCLDLSNVIIDDVIDLSKVNLEYSKVGKHKVKNLDKSYAPLNHIDLSEAEIVDIEKYELDENGNVVVKNAFPVMKSTRREKGQLKVYSTANSAEMAFLGLNNGAEGIGLVRIEDFLKDPDDIKNFFNLLILSKKCKSNTEEFEEYAGKYKSLLSKKMSQIMDVSKDKKIIIRLFDFKLDDLIEIANLSNSSKYIDFGNHRGSSFYDYNVYEVLKLQLHAIFEEAEKRHIDVFIMLPMVLSIEDFKRVKEVINKVSSNYNLLSLKVGSMIETYKICLDSYYEFESSFFHLAQESDFISIGTNDLTSFVERIKRDPNLSEFIYLTEKVKDVITQIVEEVKAANSSIPIGVCGNHSNYISNISFFDSLGIDYVCCNPQNVSSIIEFINKKSNEEAQTNYRVLKI